MPDNKDIFLPDLVYDRLLTERLPVTADGRNLFPKPEIHIREEHRQSDHVFQLIPGNRFKVEGADVAKLENVGEETLDKGGLAVMLQGYDERLQRPVLIKVLNRRRLTDEQARDDLYREARILAKLDHPNIVRVYGLSLLPLEDQVSGCTNFKPAIIMEKIEGEDLGKKIAANKREPLASDFILKVVRDMADAVDYCHRYNVVHLDVSPSNIMIDGNGRPVLIDFGLSRPHEKHEPNEIFSVKSTPGFTPPEALLLKQDSPAKKESDVYMLAGCIYAMLGGPREMWLDPGMSKEPMHHQITKNCQLIQVDSIKPEVMTVLKKGLSFRPENRFHSAAELLAALEKALK